MKDIIVIDQSKDSKNILENLPRVKDVVITEHDQNQFEALGHDHPSALDQCLKQYPFRTDRIVILDSDCFPVDSTWLDSEREVRLAADPHKAGLSHPCFMDFPTETRHEVNFSEGCISPGIDTGRLVALQLVNAGLDVDLLAARMMFRGVRGHLYSGSIYHHGSGSFTGHLDQRLAQQTNERVDSVLRKKVFRNDFSVSLPRVLSWKTKSLLQNLNNRSN